MPKKNESEWAGWIGVLVLLGSLYLVDWNFLHGGFIGPGQITDYRLACPVDLQNGRCPQKWRHHGRTDYTIYASDQVVVSQVEGQAPVRLNKCAVVDRKNWKCNLFDGPQLEGFTGGEFWDGWENTPGGPPQRYDFKGVRHVSRWEYILAEFR